MFLLHVFSLFSLCFSIFGFTTSPLSLSLHFYSHQAQTTCWDHPKMTELYHALGETVKLCSSVFYASTSQWGTVMWTHTCSNTQTRRWSYTERDFFTWTSNYNLIFHPTPEMSTALVLTRGQLVHNHSL